MKAILEKILSLLAHLILAKYKPEVIAVTGSVGKTSTKNAIFAVLRARFSVRSSEGSYNNELGVPLSIIGCRAQGKNIFGWFGVFLQALFLILIKNKNYPEMLVLEFAADHPGDIEKLSKLVRPRIGVLTAIAIAHTQFFKTLLNIKEEKSKLIKLLPTNGLAVLNLDEPIVAELALTTKVKVLTYGVSLEAETRATDITYTREGTRAKITQNNNTATVFLPNVLGIGHVSACLAACAIGREFGLLLSEMAEALHGYDGSPGRMQMMAGIKNTFLINDTYNASPLATKAALEVLRSLPIDQNAKKITAFGDMLELGELTESAHREVARQMMFADYIVLVGRATHWTYQELKKLGYNDKNLMYFDTPDEAGRYLQTVIRQGDCLLVKGSRGMKMEKIIDELKSV